MLLIIIVGFIVWMIVGVTLLLSYAAICSRYFAGISPHRVEQHYKIIKLHFWIMQKSSLPEATRILLSSLVAPITVPIGLLELAARKKSSINTRSAA